MIRTTFIPQDTNLQLSLDIPEDYVGKKNEVLIFAVDEPKEHLVVKNKAAKYRGTLHLSDEQYSELQQHVIDIRNE